MGFLPQKGRKIIRRIEQRVESFFPKRVRIQKNIRMIYIFKEGSTIEIPSILNKYHYCRYQPKFERQWIDLLNNNHELGHWDEDRFLNEMLGNLLIGTETMLFDQEKLIGTCAAFSMESYKPYLVLAYPIVLPAYRNQGLGTFLVSKTLEICHFAGYPGIVLNTQHYRASAIKVYQKIGFTQDN
jgi:GNAT superfamily N-acetyltransferase